MAEFDSTYASNGKGNLGVTLGAIGTGLGLLGGGLGMFNRAGGSQGGYISKETFDKQTEISELNSKIALLEAEKDSESKMIDVYERVTTRILADERQYANDLAAQQVVNANLQSATAVNSNNIAQLMNLTKLVVPNTSVCPGWGNVTITPTTT